MEDDWKIRAITLIRENVKRHRIAWTPSSLLASLEIVNNPRNRRRAKKVLESLWTDGEIVRRLEVHGTKCTATSPYIREVAYSLPEAILRARTTREDPYEPHKFQALFQRSQKKV